jgi:hypothetical protein
VDTTSQALTLPLMYAQNRKVFQKTGKEPNYVVTSPEAAPEGVQARSGAGAVHGRQRVAAGNVEGSDINGMTVYRAAGLQERGHVLPDGRGPAPRLGGRPVLAEQDRRREHPPVDSGQDSYGSKITVRLNLGARRRNSHAALKGLT